MRELRPCPICKTDGYVYAIVGRVDYGRVACCCNKCKLREDIEYDTIDEAEEAWNDSIATYDEIERKKAGGDNWIPVENYLPEDLEENKDKKIIKCFTTVESSFPNGKPTVQFRERCAERNYDGEYTGKWYWSKIGQNRVTHWQMLPEPANYEQLNSQNKNR